MMEIYIVRHGETMWNHERRFQGQTDVPLSYEGRETAGITGKALSDVSFDMIWSSPLIRAYETANLIRGYRNIEIRRDDRLMEMCFGVLEGADATDAFENKENPLHDFFEAPEKYIPPKGGETIPAIAERAAGFLVHEIEPFEEKYSRVMIVAHGALNHALLMRMMKRGFADFWAGEFVKNCGIVIMRLENGEYTMLEEARYYYSV